MAETAKRGDGAFQWSAGGWFGAQIGSTIWLLGVAATYLAQGRRDAAWPAALAFGGAQVLGLALWSQRARLAPYPAIQWLVATLGLTTLAALVSLDALGVLGAIEPRLASVPRALYGLVALYPALMAMFALQERAARRRR